MTSSEPRTGPEETHLRPDWIEAHAAITARVEPLSPVHVALGESHGLRVAQEVTAPVHSPAESRSAVDGWAVNGSGPWIIAEPGARLSAHQAGLVGKGRAVPPGTKAVLPSGEVRIGLDAEGLAVVERSAGARPGAPRNGENIMVAGAAASAGESLARAGDLLGPGRLARLAEAGLGTVPVLPRPLVHIIQSGHLQSAGLAAPDEDRDALGPVLEPLLRGMGARVAARSRIGVTRADWLRALSEDADGAAVLPDVVLTIGGTGDGEEDALRAALEDLGAEPVVDGLSTTPARSALVSALPDGRHVLGLPGTPGEALTALAVLGGPLLDALRSRVTPAPRPVPFGSAYEARLLPTHLVPGRSVFGMASPCGTDGSLRDWADAALLLALPPHGLRMGDDVLALPLPWLTVDRDGAPEGARAPATPESPARRASNARTSAARTSRNAAATGPIDWEAQDWDSLRAPSS
ncbi:MULTISPECIES: molybdopterin-binding protein [Arthrobacter]|uniref:Molybdopterin molybdenumtransferase n=2 Tax=Arthrobacter TaxID=1663 RepID=A0ABU9KLH4_9MICC|nr:molybdopterin-binding protein [Arthrobacter sp. YJM1]MDP5227751.1 molybdopterin-binding protein [Arthrobacter sp. YJM1]